jgi:outer membrane protein assembly factor BamA
VVAIALLAAFTLCDAQDGSLANASRSDGATERILHVGQIYVIGADDMSASAILNELPFQTGDRIPANRLQEVEHRLDRLKLFVVDKASGVHPTIAELPDGQFTNLRVTVKLRTRP